MLLLSLLWCLCYFYYVAGALAIEVMMHGYRSAFADFCNWGAAAVTTVVPMPGLIWFWYYNHCSCVAD